LTTKHIKQGSNELWWRLVTWCLKALDKSYKIVWLHLQKKIETRDIQGSKYLKQHKFWKKMSFGYNPYERHTIYYRKEGGGLFFNQCHVNLRQVCDLKMVQFPTNDLHYLTCACDLSTRWSWMYHVLLIPILELPHALLSLLHGVRERTPKFFLLFSFRWYHLGFISKDLERT